MSISTKQEASSRLRRPRVALVADLKEEGWPSMDRVAETFLQALIALPKEFDIQLLRPRMLRLFSRIPGFQSHHLPFNTDRLINRFLTYSIWILGKRGKFDLFHIVDHSYSQLVHVLDRRRVLVTCHDLDTFRCLLNQEEVPAGFFFRGMTSHILSGFRKSHRVTCDSQSTMDEILRHALLPDNKLSLCRMGVSTEFFRAVPLDLVPGKPRLLHVGSTIERKRIDVLLKVYSEVRKRIPGCELIRIGGPLSCEQQALARNLGILDAITTLENISETELVESYAAATLLLQPSDAEGFGLPVVEAMASGTPVLASDLPVLREIGGDAAEYAAVAELDEWVERICYLSNEAHCLPDQWQLRKERCRVQAGKFSWDQTAMKIAGIYREMLNSL